MASLEFGRGGGAGGSERLLQPSLARQLSDDANSLVAEIEAQRKRVVSAAEATAAVASNANDPSIQWRLTPVKGVPRMDGKRSTDHAAAQGCRPALNIDVIRLIAVAKTPELLVAAAAPTIGRHYPSTALVLP